MAMRAQLSLVFHDEDLYKQFILPKKNDKELHSIVIKCLSSYYYDEEVRNRIDGVSEDSFVVDEGKVKSDEKLFEDIRGILAMQSILCSELENTVEDGLDEFNDILSGVNSSMKTNGTPEDETEYGTKLFSLPQLDSVSTKEPVRQEKTIPAQPQIVQVVQPNEDFQLIIEYLKTKPDYNEFIASKTAKHSSEAPVVEETPITEPEPKVELAMEEEPIIFEEPTIAEEPKDNDARDALRESFGSVFNF